MSNQFDGIENVITLVDEDGNEQEFSHLSTMELDGSVYVALEPVYGEDEEAEDDGEFIILKVLKDEDGEDLLSAIEDEEEFERIAAVFEDHFADEDFDEGDEDEGAETEDGEIEDDEDDE